MCVRCAAARNGGHFALVFWTFQVELLSVNLRVFTA
jgi:hypothetical protein